MRDMNWYLDRARERAGITSDARLAKTLGVAQPNVPNMRKGRHLPSYAVMEHLAELAGVTTDEAATDFARWQAERGGSPAFAAAYERLFRHVAGTAAVVALVAVMLGAGEAKANLTGTSKQVNSFNYTLCDKSI